MQNAAYTFVASDAGKTRYKTGASAYTWTVPSGVFAAGDVLTVLNSGTSGNLTLAPGAGMTLWLAGAGTNGARTVAPTGLVTVYFVASGSAFVSGSGLT